MWFGQLSHAPELVFVMVCSVACEFLKTEVKDELHMSRANEKPERPRATTDDF